MLVTCILLTRVNFYCVVVFCNYQHLNEWGPISADSIKRSFRPILLIMSRYIKDMALPLGSPLPARNWKWKSIFKTIASYIFFVLNVLWHFRCYVGLEPMGLFWPPWNTKLPYILKSRKLFRSWPFNHKYSCVLYYYASNGIKFMAPGIFFTLSSESGNTFNSCWDPLNYIHSCFLCRCASVTFQNWKHSSILFYSYVVFDPI